MNRQVSSWVEIISAMHHLNCDSGVDADRPRIELGYDDWYQLMVELKNSGFDIDPLDPPEAIRLHDVDIEMRDSS